MFSVHVDAQGQKNGNLALSYWLEEMNKNSRFYRLQYFANQIKTFGLDFSARRSHERIARNKEQGLIWSYIDCSGYFGNNGLSSGKTSRNIQDQNCVLL